MVVTEIPPPPPVSHAHHPPPPAVLALHKQYIKIPIEQLANDPYILDLDNISDYHKTRLQPVSELDKDRLLLNYNTFLGGEVVEDPERIRTTVYTHKNVPGIQILPSLPPEVQTKVLDCVLLRDLSNPTHKTNLHAHYHLPYSKFSEKVPTYFHLDVDSKFEPLDPSVHKPMTVQQAMKKKLRWMTLGGQYDWTKKVYPEMLPKDGDCGSDAVDRKDEVPRFPSDLKYLIQGLFPQIVPEAAIANFYSPGDQLSPHRDVSEKSCKGLVSISIGCDALFLIGFAPDPLKEDGTAKTADEIEAESRDHVLLVRLKSGDVIVMNGESRWAWHAVPKVIRGTCPLRLQSWPGEVEGLSGWDGWMSNKRVNLNVRQMWDPESSEVVQP